MSSAGRAALWWLKASLSGGNAIRAYGTRREKSLDVCLAAGRACRIGFLGRELEMFKFTVAVFTSVFENWHGNVPNLSMLTYHFI